MLVIPGLPHRLVQHHLRALHRQRATSIWLTEERQSASALHIAAVVMI